MNVPTQEKLKASRKSPRSAKLRYRGGKALQRIIYFETQRALSPTILVRGFVTSEAINSLRISKKAPTKRRPKAAATSQYTRADRARTSLIPRTFAASATLPVWRPLGPRSIPEGQTYGGGGNNKPPVSGRCCGIFIAPANPDHLIVCSAGGGLWATMDHGKSWRPLTDQEPTLSMGAICVSPSASNVVYAATGEGDTYSQLGVGLLRSADGGLTWEHVPASELSGTGVFDIAVDPIDPLHLWVGTTEQLLESSDGGASWRVAQEVNTTWDISINPQDAKEIYIATVLGLIGSIDGGATWRRISLSGSTSSSRFTRMEVCHAPSNPAVVYVGAVLDGKGLLWRRASKGGAFSPERPPSLDLKSDIEQAWYDWCLAVSPDNPNQLYWGAVELYKGIRSSSGWSWRNISSRSSGDSIHPDQHHLAFDPSDPNVLYVCNDGGLFRSPDRGTSWVSLNRGLGITEFEFITHLESENNWLIGGTQDNGTLGHPVRETWKQIALGDGGACAADDADKLCYHSYYGMDIERAPATGKNAFKWEGVSPPVADNYEALFYPPMDVRNKVVAKAGVTLWISDDSGASWEEVDFGGAAAEKASALSIVGPKTILLGTEKGRLVQIERASTGWAKARVTQLSSPRKEYISDIVAESSTQTIWTSCSAFGGGHVFQSTNNGSTWSDRTGNLPDIPVNAIVVDPKDTRRIFAATDHGVYQSQNSGVKWGDFSNGLPNAVVGDMVLHARRRALRAGTRNRGAWEVDI